MAHVLKDVKHLTDDMDVDDSLSLGSASEVWVEHDYEGLAMPRTPSPGTFQFLADFNWCDTINASNQSPDMDHPVHCHSDADAFMNIFDSAPTLSEMEYDPTCPMDGYPISPIAWESSTLSPEWSITNLEQYSQSPETPNQHEGKQVDSDDSDNETIETNEDAHGPYDIGDAVEYTTYSAQYHDFKSIKQSRSSRAGTVNHDWSLKGHASRTYLRTDVGSDSDYFPRPKMKKHGLNDKKYHVSKASELERDALWKDGNLPDVKDVLNTILGKELTTVKDGILKPGKLPAIKGVLTKILGKEPTKVKDENSTTMQVPQDISSNSFSDQGGLERRISEEVTPPIKKLKTTQFSSSLDRATSPILASENPKSLQVLDLEYMDTTPLNFQSSKILDISMYIESCSKMGDSYIPQDNKVNKAYTLLDEMQPKMFKNMLAPYAYKSSNMGSVGDHYIIDDKQSLDSIQHAIQVLPLLQRKHHTNTEYTIDNSLYSSYQQTPLQPRENPQTVEGWRGETHDNLLKRALSYVGRRIPTQQQMHLDPRLVGACMCVFPEEQMLHAWSNIRKPVSDPDCDSLSRWSPIMYENRVARTYRTYFPIIMNKQTSNVTAFNKDQEMESNNTMNKSWNIHGWIMMPSLEWIQSKIIKYVIAASGGLLVCDSGRPALATIQINHKWIYRDTQSKNINSIYERFQSLLTIVNPLTHEFLFLPPLPYKTYKNKVGYLNYSNVRARHYRLIILAWDSVKPTRSNKTPVHMNKFGPDVSSMRPTHELMLAIYSSTDRKWVHFDAIRNAKMGYKHLGGRGGCIMINYGLYYGGIKVEPNPEAFFSDSEYPAIFYINCSMHRLQQLVFPFFLQGISEQYRITEPPKLIRATQNKVFATTRDASKAIENCAGQIVIVEVLLNQDGTPSGQFAPVVNGVMPQSLTDKLFKYGKLPLQKYPAYEVVSNDDLIAFRVSDPEVVLYDVQKAEWKITSFHNNQTNSHSNEFLMFEGEYKPDWLAQT